MLVSKHDLARLLSATVKVVETRTTIPILSTVRLVGTGGQLTATATDLDIEVSASTPVEGDLAVCVDAKLLASVVNKAAGNDITIEPSDGSIVVKSGRNRSTLHTLPVDDFPSMQAGELPVEFEADLASIFDSLAFAQSDETTRYYLCGIFLEPSAAAATNGHKMATQEFDALGAFEPIIVPRKTVSVMPKGAVTVRLSATKIQFVSDDVTLTSKLIDATYPDWRRVMPVGNDKFITVDSAALKSASDRVAAISNERERAVKLAIGSGEIVLTVRGEGEAVDVVACDYDGEPIEVGFNVGYLNEVLSSLPAGEITIALADAGAPALFTSEQAPGMRVVLMPRRV